MTATVPEGDKQYPVEPKVWAGSGGSAGFGALLVAISNIVQDQDTGVLLGGGVPEWLEPVVAAALLFLATFVPAWNARHQHRRPLLPPAEPPVEPLY